MSIIGNPILLSGGGTQSLLNVPITISTTEPTPERIGHLWVVSDNDEQIAKIEFNETINADAEDGTLQLIVPLTAQHLDLSQYMKIGTRKVIGTLESGNTISQWIIGDVEKNDEHYKLYVDAYPLVYFNIDGVRYIENAYVWSGTEWFMCCQKDHYLVAPYGTKAGLYNIINYTSTVESNIAAASNHLRPKIISPKGGYMFYGETKKFYKKNGDAYEEWINSPIQLVDYTNSSVYFSPDENLVIISKDVALGDLYRITENGLSLVCSDIGCFTDSGNYKGQIAFIDNNNYIVTKHYYWAGGTSTNTPAFNIYKYNYSTSTYELASYNEYDSYSFSASDILITSLGDRSFAIHFSPNNKILKVIFDDNGIVVSDSEIYSNKTSYGSRLTHNAMFADRTGKWLIFGSHSSNLTGSYEEELLRGRIIILNTETNTSQVKLMWDSTCYVVGIFDNGEDNIKVLTYSTDYGYQISTWKDTGEDSLEFVSLQRILGSDNLTGYWYYTTACPVLAQ